VSSVAPAGVRSECPTAPGRVRGAAHLVALDGDALWGRSNATVSSTGEVGTGQPKVGEWMTLVTVGCTVWASTSTWPVSGRGRCEDIIEVDMAAVDPLRSACLTG